MTPKWVTPVALIAFLLGLGLIVLGPMLLYALASSGVDAEHSLEEQLKAVRETYAWIIPAGCGLGLGGAIALMLAWVSRPLGDDEHHDEPVDEGADE